MRLKITYDYTPASEISQGYRLRLAAEGIDMPSEVFVCQRRVASATDAEYNELPDKFISLADPVDLEQYPIDVPDLDNNMPFYRVSQISLVFRTAEELDEVKQMLDEDMRELLNSLNIIGSEYDSEDVVYGG